MKKADLLIEIDPDLPEINKTLKLLDIQAQAALTPRAKKGTEIKLDEKIATSSRS